MIILLDSEKKISQNATLLHDEGLRDIRDTKLYLNMIK